MVVVGEGRQTPLLVGVGRVSLRGLEIHVWGLVS